MRKEGPCRHCGVTSTPLWRNGPPEKPVLCNACGSRWRTKGSLTNYIPLHAREPLSSDDLNVPKRKSISFKLNDHKSQKKRQNDSAVEGELKVQYCDQNFRKIEEGDSSNQCSSESAISGSESCVHFGTTDASDITGSVQSNAWDSVVPSKKRTFMSRPKPSPVEKLTKDLYFILHEEQASNLTITSEDDLLYDSATPFDSSEIGYGGILIKRPPSKSIEEESEACSFALDKSHGNNEGYSGGSAHFIVTEERNGRTLLNYGNGKMKSSEEISHENAKRYKTSHEKLKMLQDRKFPLGSTDLDVSIYYEAFMKSLTYNEQQLLMKYLPSIDTAELPESLKNMFASPQFSETLSLFQRLLQEGVFDLSWTGANAEECSQLKRLVLLNCVNSKWLECYQKLKDAAFKKIIGNGKLNKHMQAELSNFASLRKDYEKQNQKHLDQKTTMRSPKRLCSSGVMNPPSKCSSQLEPSAISKLTDDTGELVDQDGACFSSRRVPFLSDRTSMLAPTYFVADNSDADLLLDVRCGASFPEAELIYPPWKQEKNQNASTTEIGLEAADRPSSSFINK